MDSLQQNVSAAIEEVNPSVLSLIIGKHEAIEQTVSLIKRELTQDMISDLAPESSEKQQSISNANTEEQAQQQPKSEEEFNGLTTLLENSSIQSAIKVVAGNDTQAIIDKALVELKSSETVDDKSKVFTDGIKKLHANLSQSDKSKLHNDPLFNLAIGLVGLRQNKRN